MQISRDFTIGIHTLLCIAFFQGEKKITSEFIASSVGVNPVIIRRILQKLKSANLIEVKAGTGGANLLKSEKQISLYEIYFALECNRRDLINFHENPNQNCPVGKSIHQVLDGRFSELTKTFETKLKSMKLSDLISDLKKN